MFVITGATGNTGNRLTSELLEAGMPVKAIGRNAEKLGPLQTAGAEIAVGDLEDSDFLLNTFIGAKAVYAMIPPNVHTSDFLGYQHRVGNNLAESLERGKVFHAVTLSSVGAHLEDERAGVVAGLRDMEQRFAQMNELQSLHLRAGYFMENLMDQIPVIRGMGMMATPLSPDVAIPMVATRDIASTAAKRLLALDFEGSQVEYVLGERDVTFREVTDIIGKAIDMPQLKYHQMPFEDFRQTLVGQWGLSEDYVNRICQLIQSMNDGSAFEAHTRTEDNTSPTTIEEFAVYFAQAYQQS